MAQVAEKEFFVPGVVEARSVDLQNFLQVATNDAIADTPVRIFSWHRDDIAVHEELPSLVWAFCKINTVWIIIQRRNKIKGCSWKSAVIKCINMAKIYWAGQSCFEISVSNAKDSQATIVIDPFDEKIGLKLPNLSADVLLVTHNHADHNNVKGVKGEPFVIDSPGEYEVKGVFVQGIPSFHDEAEGKERGQNTIYIIESEGMRFCHLGDFGQKELTDEQLDKIGHVDILMIPVGGTYTISSAEAPKVIGQIEPKIVIPMHYALPKLTVDVDGVEKFLKAMGKTAAESVDKLTVKVSTLPKDSDMEIVVLKP